MGFGFSGHTSAGRACVRDLLSGERNALFFVSFSRGQRDFCCLACQVTTFKHVRFFKTYKLMYIFYMGILKCCLDLVPHHNGTTNSSLISVLICTMKTCSNTHP